MDLDFGIVVLPTNRVEKRIGRAEGFKMCQEICFEGGKFRCSLQKLWQIVNVPVVIAQNSIDVHHVARGDDEPEEFGIYEDENFRVRGTGRPGVKGMIVFSAVLTIQLL